MLEDELTSILVDDDIKQLIIVDNTEEQGLARKLRSQNRPFLVTDFEEAYNLVKKRRQGTQSHKPSIKRRDVRHLLRRRSVNDFAVVVHVLPLRLHVDSMLLKQEVYCQIERMAAISDGIFVLYGVCDALWKVKHDFVGSTCPLFFLADDDGTTVEDCIALALGGNQVYANVLTNDNSIMLFLTPMVAAQWHDLSEDFRLMKHARFKKIAKLDTGLSFELDFDANVDKCAKHFKLYPVLLRGNTNVIQKSYLRAKKGVCKNDGVTV
jgi:Protein of unknown function (DUF1638)